MSGRNNQLSDPTLRIVFKLDKSKTLSDVTAGTPVKEYWFLADTIIRKDTGSPVSKLIAPFVNSMHGEWQIPLFVEGKIIGFGEIVNDTTSGDRWEWVGGGGGGAFLAKWQKVIDKWPISKGYHPILIGFPYPDVFFHVPEKDAYNLTFLGRFYHPEHPDSLQMVTDTTYSKLSDSRQVLKYLLPHP